jgi:hypothetical protein
MKSSETYILITSAVAGAIVVPLVVFVSHRIKYIGGALAALPIVDLLPILFISREAASSQLLGDVGGQVGAVFAIFGAYAVVDTTAWGRANKNSVVLMFLAGAVVINLLVFVLLRTLKI